MSILRMAQAALLLIAAAICLTVSAPRQAFAADPAINEYALGVTDGKLTVGGADVTEHDLSSTVPKYQAILSAALGILAITMFILTLIQFVKLGGAGDNLMRRRRAINGRTFSSSGAKVTR